MIAASIAKEKPTKPIPRKKKSSSIIDPPLVEAIQKSSGDPEMDAIAASIMADLTIAPPKIKPVKKKKTQSIMEQAAAPAANEFDDI